VSDTNENNRDRDAIRGLVREALERRIGGEAATPPPADSAPPAADESLKRVITEADVRDLPAGTALLLREDAIVTPAARDLLGERAIEVRYRARRAGRNRIVAVGSDHGGFEMKEALKKYLDELGCAFRDFGTFSTEPADYPDTAHAVARAVADGAADLGIIVDGAGIGSCMTANKVPGVRAAMCYDEATSRNSREHNYANVLTLGGRMISEQTMRDIVRVWLSTPEGEARHAKRVAKIMAIEKQYLLR
jgi:ribose 5-phosphate isomerase B